MGIRDDIQTELANAFDTDLLDAVKIIQFVSVSNSYDEDTMINTVVETSTDVRGVVEYEYEGEKVDQPTLLNNFKILILANETNGVIFEVDMKIINGTDTYMIKGFNQDPAIATWIIYARRLG